MACVKNSDFNTFLAGNKYQRKIEEKYSINTELVSHLWLVYYKRSFNTLFTWNNIRKYKYRVL